MAEFLGEGWQFPIAKDEKTEAHCRGAIRRECSPVDLDYSFYGEGRAHYAARFRLRHP